MFQSVFDERGQVDLQLAPSDEIAAIVGVTMREASSTF
jgi:hypothetical protein